MSHVISIEFGVERQALVCEEVSAPAVAGRWDALQGGFAVAGGHVVVDDRVVIHIDVAIAVGVEAFAVAGRTVIVAPARSAGCPGCDVLGVHVTIVVEVERMSGHVGLELPVRGYTNTAR
jgi:hypothetical protein